MRILFVASAASSHTAGWIDQLAGMNWDIHVVPSWELDGKCPSLPGTTIHDLGPILLGGVPEGTSVSGQWPLKHGAWRVAAMHRYMRLRHRAYLLARTIRRVKPDIIHVLEMQHSGYLLAEAMRAHRIPRIPVVYSSWGSDIAHFGNQPEHADRIRTALGFMDYHISDCERDLALAREFGFEGVSLGVAPGRGGFDIAAMRQLQQSGPSSARRLLLVKGYQNEEWGGRGLNILAALGCLGEGALEGYEVRVFSVVDETAAVVRHLQLTTGLDIDFLPRMPHDELMSYMGRARAVVSCGTTDGTPNVMLEAMAMGALPVQSDAGATSEWIDEGVTGLLVGAEDIDSIVAGIKRAIEDDALVDAASDRNADFVMERIDRSVVLPRVLAWYREVFSMSNSQHGMSNVQG